jgi:hypothetical protein
LRVFGTGTMQQCFGWEKSVSCATDWRRCGDRYNGNPHYFGGVVAFTRTQFLKVNGFPNTFWGCVLDPVRSLVQTSSMR